MDNQYDGNQYDGNDGNQYEQYDIHTTHPDWRNLQRLTFYSVYSDVIQRRNKKRRVLTSLYKTIHKEHTLAGILYHVTYDDIHSASIELDMPEIVLGDIALYFQPFIENDEDFIFKYRY
jgi:hypothetical protein